jgi:ATP-dependent helicase HrpB
MGPGRCVRLWQKGESRPEKTGPEINRSDLSALLLECLLWGVKDRLDLPWLDPPPAAAWERGRELLEELGAVDKEGRPTAKGRAMARMGLEPRLAALCVGAAASDTAAPLGCAAAAILADRDGSGQAGADFRERLSLLRLGGASTAAGAGTAAWISRTRELALDLLQRLDRKGTALSWSLEDEADAGELLGTAFPDRIGRRRESPREGTKGDIEAVYRFTGGREALLGGPLASAQWIAAPEIDAGERMGIIRMAAPLSPESAPALLKNSITVEYAVVWKEPLKDLIPRSTMVKKAGAIVLSEDRTRSTKKEVIPALKALLTEQEIGILPWDEDGGRARRLLDRVRFFDDHAPGGGGSSGGSALSWDNAALAAELETWLGPFLWDGAEQGDGRLITGRGLEMALTARLGWELKEKLEHLVPSHFTPPIRPARSGSNPRKPRPVPIDYSGGEPAVRIRLQDCFGITSPCEVLGLPLLFHLLSPADRPIQVTRDLGGFWKGSYREVRKDMRGRYPKHDWPEM